MAVILPCAFSRSFVFLWVHAAGVACLLCSGFACADFRLGACRGLGVSPVCSNSCLVVHLLCKLAFVVGLIGGLFAAFPFGCMLVRCSCFLAGRGSFCTLACGGFLAWSSLSVSSGSFAFVGEAGLEFSRCTSC
jgi:hypothetical protein